jgi:hypothetical protein
MFSTVLQGFDAQAMQCQFDIIDLQAEAGILDQHLQRLYNACTVRHS